MTGRQFGVSACVVSIMLLGVSLVGGRGELNAAPNKTQVVAAKAPHVEGAWVRLPAASGRPAGGYMLVHGTGKADALVGATSPKAERIELHSMVMDNGVMKMRAETKFALPANGELRFEPGANHLMLFGLSSDLKAGGTIPITLRFQSGAAVEMTAKLQAAGSPAPAGQSGAAHQH